MHNDQSGFQSHATLATITDGPKQMTGHWLGQEDAPLVTVVDTPGFSDSAGADGRNRKVLVEYLKKIGEVHAFLWVRKADSRLSNLDNEFFKLFSSMFGKEEFSNRLIMVLTKYDMMKCSPYSVLVFFFFNVKVSGFI